jgi:hypothetical protein
MQFDFVNSRNIEVQILKKGGLNFFLPPDNQSAAEAMNAGPAFIASAALC